MAFYWLTEFLPIAVTSLLPIVLFPLLGILTTDEICRAYVNVKIPSLTHLKSELSFFLLLGNLNGLSRESNDRSRSGTFKFTFQIGIESSAIVRNAAKVASSRFHGQYFFLIHVAFQCGYLRIDDSNM